MRKCPTTRHNGCQHTGTLKPRFVMDKGNVEFEFPPLWLVRPCHVRRGRALVLAPRLHCMAAMFKSYKTGMCSALSDIRVVFIEIFEHFAPNLDIRALKHNGVLVELYDRSDMTQLWTQIPLEILLKPPKIRKKNPEFFPPGPTPQVQDGAGYILSVILTSHLSPHI